MSDLLIVIILLVLLGGGGHQLGYISGPGGILGLLLTVVVIVFVLRLARGEKL